MPKTFDRIKKRWDTRKQMHHINDCNDGRLECDPTNVGLPSNVWYNDKVKS